MKIKICIGICGLEKSLSEFYFRKDTGKYRNQCNECHCLIQKKWAIDNLQELKKYLKLYYLEHKNKLRKQKDDYHKKYPWKRVLDGIKQRCNDLNNFRYGGRAIKCKISEKELEFLWYRDKAYLMEKPSIDRKNNDGNYTLKNCRFIEKSLNSKKDKYKSILQFDLNENFIKEFSSVKEASKQTLSTNISAVLKGKRKTAKGFIWRYKYE